MMTVSIEQDLSQREQALNIQESFIIQAPAGSGKTELLIQRLLALLANVNAPEEILAITFTKKAANEMRERVIKALKDAVNTSEPDSAHKRKTWQLAKNALRRDSQHNWQLIENPNQLQIKTIDSLCSYLTAQLPLLAQFGSQPSIADTSTYLYEEAAQQVLMQIEDNAVWSDSIAELLLHLDNDLNQLKDLIIALLSKRDQWLPHIFSEIDEQQSILDLLELQISHVWANAIATVSALFPPEEYAEALQLKQYADNNLKIKLESLDCSPDDSTTWQKIASLLLTKEFTWRKAVDSRLGFPAPSSSKNTEEKKLFEEYKFRIKTLLAELEPDEDLRLALEDISRLPRPGTQQSESAVLVHLIPVLKLAAAQLRLTFQKHGKIDFIENALAALTALGNDHEPTNLALALDYKIQHILMDEFQDTSSTQYQLLHKLTYGWQSGDGRTLFVVGDPMQSIYRFREAEVGLFLRMRVHGLAGIKLTPLTLSLNFRSAPAIVDWNNTHFSAIFPQHTNPATGAVTYSPSVTQQKDENAEVDIIGFSPNTQSNYIIEKIAQWQRHYPTDNVAILVRSRSHLKSILPSLQDNNIAYQAIEIDPLSTRQHILDLLSLTSALLHLADRIAWLSVLRAPWSGLSLADLLTITDCQKQATIWERLANKDVQQQLSKQGQASVLRLLPPLQRALSLRGRCTLRDWIETTWLLLGGPACLNSETQLNDAKNYFETLSKLDNDSAHFNTEQLKEKINKAYAAAEKDAQVKIMTIHAAKGLEFDSVILPHLEKSLPADDKSLLLWMEHTLQNNEAALLLAPLKEIDAKRNVTYEYIRWQQKTKSQFETDRLFYVAATRAKKRLVLCYDKPTKLSGDSFLKKLQPFLGEITLDEKIIVQQHERKPVQVLSRITSAWVNPFKLHCQPKSTLHNTFTGFVLGSDTPRKVGITIHTVLQQLAQRSISWWQQLDDVEQKTLVGNLLTLQGLSTKNKIEASLTVLLAINNTIQDKRGQWILGNHQDAHAEYALTAYIDDDYQHLVIDRTFIDEQGVRWIIDYKTSQPAADCSLDEFFEKEKEAYTPQLQRYVSALRPMTTGEIKLGLYFPLVSGWVELL